MGLHARHVFPETGEVRPQIKFVRNDLLYHYPRPLRDPWADQKLQHADPGSLPEVEVPSLPIEVGPRLLVGPTILDMLVRRRWRTRDLPKPTRQALKERFANTPLPTAVVAWSMRDLDALWPEPGQPQRRSQPRPEAEDDLERPVHHPFLTSLASGGAPVNDATTPVGWVKVRKRSTCRVGEHTFRLAIGVFGGLSRAYERIAELAADAWDEDLARALELWTHVQAAPGHVLIEDKTIALLRPICSVSQHVERTVMREACEWLGVDPDLDLRRPSGRPTATAEQGEVLRVEFEDFDHDRNRVIGRFIRPYQNLPEGTRFEQLSLQVLVSILGSLRQDALETDAALLEAWPDAASPEWRERAAEGDVGSQGAAAPDPYEVLGVTPDATLEEITAAYRRTIKAIHPDTGGASGWLARTVIEAYRKVRETRGGV